MTACVGPAPLEDYNLSYVAMESAKKAQAPKYAPGFWAQAQDVFEKAVADFEDRRYPEAQKGFISARELAEKAENYTVVKKAESGAAD